MFDHIQKEADWCLRQAQSEIDTKIGGAGGEETCFFASRNVSIAAITRRRNGMFFRTPMTLKCQHGDDRDAAAATELSEITSSPRWSRLQVVGF